MKDLYDVIIVGGGPAGLTAAIYLARAQYRVLVLEKEQLGGQIAITDEVVNYPGIKHISGRELTETMKAQADSFGAEFEFAEVTGIKTDEKEKTVHTDKGDFKCIGILIATGACPRSIGFKGEEEFKGHGVAYCATCDGEFFTGKEIFAIGGGYAAAEESVFLTKFARHITILVREDNFTCAASVAEKAKSNEKITVLYNTEIEEISGTNGLNYARYKNTKTGEITEYRSRDGETFGVFVFAGYAPATEFLKNIPNLINEQGYILTHSNCQTNTEGVFAAGDVCIKPLRQLVTATCDGALAATGLEKYVTEKKQQNNYNSQVQSDKKRESYFLNETTQQLNEVFNKMEQKLILKLYLDNRPISDELKKHLSAMAELTDKLSLQTVTQEGSSDELPYVEICNSAGAPTGLAFHGVPNGHEFSSFVLGLYNAAGPGQQLEGYILDKINSINKPIDIKVLVTLSCSMCPDLVIAAQHIAAKNPNVTANIYDIHHFEKLRNKYNVMSVPCLVINNENVSFGKKNINQLLDFIEKI